MAIIYWKLGHLTAEGFQRPLDSYLVFRDGQVFDVDSMGWDRGVRPGDALGEMKWRHPGAVWVPWQPHLYQNMRQALREWLTAHAASFEQEDVREGWWEWPRLSESEWRRLVDEVIPRWAQRLEAGIASHPWMARWIAEEGPLLKLPVWSSSSWKTYVLRPGGEEKLWPELPLRYIPGIGQKTREMWHKRRWTRVKQVPGLLSEIRKLDGLGQPLQSDHLVVTRTFEEPLLSGVGELMRQLGEAVFRECQKSQQGVRWIRVTWSRDAGMERREREWPTTVSDMHTVIARVLALLATPPAHPFDQVKLEARLEPFALPQLGWWGDVAKKPERPRPVTHLLPSRREQMLANWDLWRMAGERG
ncbi:hypothetical protein [Sulfobacillus harzensis]|uniref:UmuC domain-containing protein n=1 Tax=Sulfobacillus harzensis TaxID=2729629 RepID=A0A7Y0L488_9FIRM|nr:hypothetical protein [Sulfobacillus harzensis]NMP23039.1 hypothetical protein [Sulfobacillus harzensis]